jgi:hypothetical protein
MQVVPILVLVGTLLVSLAGAVAYGWREGYIDIDRSDIDLRIPQKERLEAAGRWVGTRLEAVARWIGRRVVAFTLWVRTRVRRWVGDLLNPSSAYSTQLVMLAFLGIFLITGVSATAFFIVGIDLRSGSSGPFLRTVIGLATNLWVWVAVILLFGRSILFFSDRRRARKTAAETGYSYQSVRRLAEEVKKPDMDVCERVLLRTDDARSDAIDWTLDALDGHGHDSVGVSTDSTDVATDGGQPPEDGPDLFDDVEEPDSPTEDGTEDGTDGTAGVDAIPDTDEATIEDVDDEGDELPLWANLRLMRKDIQSALDIERVLWRFGTPFLTILVAELLIARIWVSAAGYVLMIGVALLGALGYYLFADRRHRRRLDKLRTDDERTPWDDCSVLVKTVDVPEETWYVGFTAGKVYASTEKRELAETVVDRSFDRLEGRHPAPTVEERNAWCLQRYIVNTEAWREEFERPLVMDELVDAVANADEGIMPKRLLADRVIEGGRGYALLGIIHIGLGRDREMVADVYRDLVQEHALVEYEVEIENGETMTAVTLGDDAQQPRLVQLRAEFSPLFRAARDTRYALPDVELPMRPEPFVEPTDD